MSILNNEEVLGIDIGSYSVKTSKNILFESKIWKGRNILSNSIKLETNNGIYTVGEGARDTDINKSKRSNNLLLLYTAIALSTTKGKIKTVVGLPIGQYKRESESFKTFILDNNKMQFKINDCYRDIEITDVAIYPEGVASIPSNFSGIILDIGGRTIDICLFIDNKITNPISIPMGTLNLFSKMINDLNALYTLDLTENDINRILKDGLYVDGIKVDERIIYEDLSNFTDDLINKLYLEYSLKTNRLLVTGGGGQFFYESIKKRVGHAILVNNPLYANAIGYYNYGLNLWR